jgi:hypothetical protein
MTDTDRLDRIGEAMISVCETLDLLNGDLKRMPTHKRGHTWHTDRLIARQGLLRKLDILRTEQAKILGTLT